MGIEPVFSNFRRFQTFFVRKVTAGGGTTTELQAE